MVRLRREVRTLMFEGTPAHPRGAWEDHRHRFGGYEIAETRTIRDRRRRLTSDSHASLLAREEGISLEELNRFIRRFYDRSRCRRTGLMARP